MFHHLPLELEDSLPGIVTHESEQRYDFEYTSSDIEKLELQACHETIRIIALRCTSPLTGAGRNIVRTIVSVCREYCMIPLAIDVVPTAEEFWEKMGFEPLDDGSRDWVHSGWSSHYRSLF